MAFNARGIVQNEIYQKLMFDKLEITEGMLVENIVHRCSGPLVTVCSSTAIMTRMMHLTAWR